MSIFADRRARFMQRMEGGVAVIRSHPIALRNGGTEYPYRADSTFWYLTGFTEPDAIAVLAPGHPEHRFILFVNPKDPAKEVWTGRRAGVEGAVRDFEADAAFALSELDAVLPRYLEGAPQLYYALGSSPEFDQRVLGWIQAVQAKARQGILAPDTLVDPARIANEMRLIKGPEEIALMKRSAEIAAEAHRQAMIVARPDMYEYELQATIEYSFRKLGAQAPSYGTICGSGPNGCILHYTANERRMGARDLVLIDAGCELDGYASDITRTFPVSGIFSREQRALYEVVLAAQKAAIATVASHPSFQAVHDVAVRRLTEGLIALGLLSGPLEQALEAEAYKPFYMHRTGHWLGMDVHDVGNYRADGEWRRIEPGMVLTVEPGLYIPEGAKVDSRWYDIGIRIEDDVLVTETGCDVLSSGVPKEIEEIEALMRAGALAGAR